MAPRKKAPKTLEELGIGVPTQIDGSADALLVSSVNRQFETIEILTSTGKPHATIHAGEGVETKSLGTVLTDVMYAAINGTMSGRGMSGDGSAVYVSQHWDDILSAVPNLPKYQLRLVPAGRAGLEEYQAPVQVFIDICKAKGALISTSLKTSKPKGRTTRERTAKAPVVLEVSF